MNNNFNLVEYGMLVVLVLVLVFFIYIAIGGDLESLLSSLL
ncbi:hypothetical protein [Orenia marismortui]|uniref:Uncharacterized protein n=1 Tax=Orenia marismortui TaxID=46469 RepID=A0A4R8HHK7_9FIRM|nr:hypothetical protein [Orenia marismortui]TDX58888.1 hypothetical protein C7959_10226 [Orenia marismortui]